MKYIKNLKHFENIIDESIDFDIETEDDWEEQEDEELDIEDMSIYCIDFKPLLFGDKIELNKLQIEQKQNRYIAYSINKYNRKVPILYDQTIKTMFHNNNHIITPYAFPSRTYGEIPRNIYFNSGCKKEIIAEKFNENITSLKKSLAIKIASRQRKLDALQTEINQLTVGREKIVGITFDDWLDKLKNG